MEFNKLFLGYYKALQNMYVDKVQSKKDYTLILSRDIDDEIWNFICFLNTKTIDDVKTIYEISKAEFKERVPRFYILQSENKDVEQIKNDYHLVCEDSWFVTDLKDLHLEFKSKLPIKVKICKNKKDVVETIMQGFSTGDPKDPYGNLSPTYRLALEKRFGLSKNNYQTIHYVAYFDKKAIAIATLTYKGKVAYLNNVTTLKEYKGNGISKEILSYALNNISKLGVKTIMFATETNAYTEEFYKKLGFKIANHGYCFEEKKSHIYFVRHGQTDDNVKEIYTGHLETPLNSKGVSQAKETALNLKDKHFDICYCSPLLRAKQTLDEILKYHKGLKVVFDDRLKERDYGEITGKSVSEVVKFNRWNASVIPPYKMETISHIYERLAEFYDEILKKEKGKNILIVAHSGVSRVSHAYFNGKPANNDYSNLSVGNAKCVEFEK